MSHQRIAQLTGLSRTTFHRHWATAGDLLFDALAGAERTVFAPGRTASPRFLDAAVDVAMPTTHVAWPTCHRQLTIDGVAPPVRRRDGRLS